VPIAMSDYGGRRECDGSVDAVDGFVDGRRVG
jgi:hypothetical protein